MLADDLLQQAYHLASVDRGKPRQANLRRAISTGYYALFHLLVAEGSARVSPKMPARLKARIARAFIHTEMKQVCKSLSAGNPSDILQELQPRGFSAELRKLAETFVLLQELRHDADYNLLQRYTRTDTLEYLDRVQNAFANWRLVRVRDEANVFLAALLFAGRWSK